MARIYYDDDCSIEPIKGRTIAVIGYGNQGHAHAQNLKDSGLSVIVGQRKGKIWERAERDGFRVLETGEAVRRANFISILIPDPIQPKVYKEEIEPNLKEGDVLLFAHGFNIHYGQIKPPKFVDVVMIAPKCPGPILRELYKKGMGPPALVAVHQDFSGKARDIALSYAKGIGCTRAGVIETTFREETETDLFGEQVVLCGGVSSLIKTAFEVLVEAGYQPEVAYFECLHELKLIVDLIYEGGLARMREAVSETAEYGDYTRGPRVIDELVKDEMRNILREVQDGTFAKEWITENMAGRPKFELLRKMEREHLIEEVGRKLRDMMPWIKGGEVWRG